MSPTHYIEKQYIFPPEDGWKENTWYIVDVCYTKNNPIHRSLFFSGFLNEEDSTPGGYNCVVNPTGDPHTIDNVLYMKVIKSIATPSDMLTDAFHFEDLKLKDHDNA